MAYNPFIFHTSSEPLNAWSPTCFTSEIPVLEKQDSIQWFKDWINQMASFWPVPGSPTALRPVPVPGRSHVFIGAEMVWERRSWRIVLVVVINWTCPISKLLLSPIIGPHTTMPLAGRTQRRIPTEIGSSVSSVHWLTLEDLECHRRCRTLWGVTVRRAVAAGDLLLWRMLIPAMPPFVIWHWSSWLWLWLTLSFGFRGSLWTKCC